MTTEREPTALCSAHEPADDAPWQCGKCGKPLGPIPPHDQATAAMIAEFAVKEGFTMAAVVGLRLEGVMTDIEPGIGGVVVKADGGVWMEEDAPPIVNELATQLRALADELDRKAAEAGQGIARRISMKVKPAGEN